ncbi:MAG: hypothetical protein EON92_19785 [Burkholderiales bacterium]|nr:MAG: hypothetical protein EON92_19785 [Burkholderiales bacterium]
MNRCIQFLILSMALLAGAVHAQGFVREAPKDVKPGRMVVSLPPVITMDGKPDRLSPGSRIRDTNNMLVLSASLAGLSVPVVYRRDSAGLVHEAWILTAEEYARLGGVDAESPQGFIKFLELLNFIFAARK